MSHDNSPLGWTEEHTAFVKDLAQKGENATTILILFEAEFPRVTGVTEETIKKVVSEIGLPG